MKENKKDIKVLVLTDDRIGTNNQAIGIANCINPDYKIYELKYNKYIKLPNFLRYIFNIGITNKNKSELAKLIKEYSPDILISGGRRAAIISIWAKKLSKLYGKELLNIQLMNPNISNKRFDLIILPKHDFKKNKYPNRDNILLTDFAPHKITREILKKEKEKWTNFFQNYNNKSLKKPYISVIIGGSTKSTIFTKEMALDLCNKLNNIGKANHGSLLISTSRRTGEEQTKIIKDNIKGINYFYTPNSNEENPILGLYSCADAIILTSESISMISEALSANSNIYVYDNDKLTTNKHKRFLSNLYIKGYIKDISDFKIKGLKQTKNKATNSSELIAQEIINRFFSSTNIKSRKKNQQQHLKNPYH